MNEYSVCHYDTNVSVILVLGIEVAPLCTKQSGQITEILTR